jgi:two-component SAPR family response regulator
MNEEDSVRSDVERFKRELRDISEPNCGRIEELKSQIKKGEILTQEAIQEAAERIAARFLGRD